MGSPFRASRTNRFRSRCAILSLILLLPLENATCDGAPDTQAAPDSPSPATAPADGEASPIDYQIGAFRSRANAEHLADDLLARGFYGELHQKTVNGQAFWTVIVKGSVNPFVSRQQQLLDAGFTSIPVRESSPTSP